MEESMILLRADYVELFLRNDRESFVGLKGFCSKELQPHEAEIIEYLKGGVGLAATALFEDRLDDNKVVTSFGWQSDGVWLWSNALEYYVRMHHFRIPQGFVEHMMRNKWVPPQIDDVQGLLEKFYATREM